jgi:hypothetical protein
MAARSMVLKGVRFSESSIIHITNAAKKNKTSFSKIVRAAVDSYLNVDFVNRLKIFEAMILSVIENAKTFSNIGSNLNQIAFKLNSNSSVENKEIIATVKELEERVKKIGLQNTKLKRMLLNIENKKIS